jgi:hypothetical protein
LLTIYVASLLIEHIPILKVKYKIYFFNLILHKVIVATSSLFDFIRVATLDLVLALTLRRL